MLFEAVLNDDIDYILECAGMKGEISEEELDDEEVYFEEWFNDFFDNPPKGIYMTNPEHDYCEYDKLTRSWIVELDGGWGDSYSIDLVGEYKGRF